LEITGSADKLAMVDFMVKKFEMEEVSVSFAQRGDVVLLRIDDSFALGIVHLDGVSAAAVAGEGLHRVPVKFATRAWKV